MPHPYEFNRLQEKAQQAAEEADRAAEALKLALDAAYPIGAVITTKQTEKCHSMLYSVVAAPQAYQSLGRERGWIWCQTAPPHWPNIHPFQVNAARSFREFHTFKVTEHPAPEPTPAP